MHDVQLGSGRCGICGPSDWFSKKLNLNICQSLCCSGRAGSGRKGGDNNDDSDSDSDVNSDVNNSNSEEDNDGESSDADGDSDDPGSTAYENSQKSRVPVAPRLHGVNRIHRLLGLSDRELKT